MTFDRMHYGMNSAVTFKKIADRVDVSIDLKAKRVTAGSPVNLK
jgi:hypothetical protein